MPDPLVGPMDLPWEIWASFVLACLSILTAWQLKKEAGGIAKTFSVGAAIGVLALAWLPLNGPWTVISYFLVAIAFLLGWLLAGMSTADKVGRRLVRSLIFLVGVTFSLTLSLRPILHAGEASALLLTEHIMWVLTFSMASSGRPSSSSPSSAARRSSQGTASIGMSAAIQPRSSTKRHYLYNKRTLRVGEFFYARSFSSCVA